MSDPQVSYGFGKKVSLPYAEAVEQVRVALKEQGFGVLTEIDVKQTLKQKLDADFRPYVILGACNPPLAYRALSTKLDVGLLLPCNVIVYEEDDGSVVKVLDPQAMMSMAELPEVEPVARDARQRLEKALDSLPD